MIEIRATPQEELQTVSHDCLHATSQHAYTIYSDGKLIAYIGLNTLSLVGNVGWPWVVMVCKNSLTARRVVRIARGVLQEWAKSYADLRVCAEEGVNEKWFSVLGFTLDTGVQPIYDGSRKMVQYSYGRQS